MKLIDWFEVNNKIDSTIHIGLEKQISMHLSDKIETPFLISLARVSNRSLVLRLLKNI